MHFEESLRIDLNFNFRGRSDRCVHLAPFATSMSIYWLLFPCSRRSLESLLPSDERTAVPLLTDAFTTIPG